MADTTDVVGEKDLGPSVDTGVMQSVVRAWHNDTGAFRRMASQPVFDDNIESGKDYLSTDDTMTMDGTMANFRGYIEANDGLL